VITTILSAFSYSVILAIVELRRKHHSLHSTTLHYKIKFRLINFAVTVWLLFEGSSDRSFIVSLYRFAVLPRLETLLQTHKSTSTHAATIVSSRNR